MKWICKICGYIHEGDAPPAICPVCKADSSKFELLEEKPAESKQAKKEKAQARWICNVCGYIHEGDAPPDICPVCKVGREHFEPYERQRVFAEMHRLGIARGVDSQVYAGIKAQCQAACEDVGQCLAMARAADREGYPEVAEALRRIAQEKSGHAARLYELMGEGIAPESEANLRLLTEAELTGCQEAKTISQRAGALGLEEIRDALLEIARDRARHGRAVEGLLKRLFP